MDIPLAVNLLYFTFGSLGSISENMNGEWHTFSGTVNLQDNPDSPDYYSNHEQPRGQDRARVLQHVLIPTLALYVMTLAIPTDGRSSL